MPSRHNEVQIRLLRDVFLASQACKDLKHPHVRRDHCIHAFVEPPLLPERQPCRIAVAVASGFRLQLSHTLAEAWGY